MYHVYHHNGSLSHDISMIQNSHVCAKERDSNNMKEM